MHSSVLLSAGYDADGETLEVEFLSGRIYRYFGVPPEVVAALMTAPSLGAYYNREIRDRYRREEVTVEGAPVVAMRRRRRRK